MQRSAARANPFSYSKPAQAFRPRSCVAHAAVLGGKSFILLFVICAVRNRFISAHIAEHAPASVQHGLRHASLRQLPAVHVPNADEAVLSHNLRGELVQEVLPAIGNPGMDRPCPSLLLRPLGHGKLRLQVSIEALRLDVLDRLVREGGEFFQTEIDTQFPGADLALGNFHLAGDVDVPVTLRILRERTCPDPAFERPRVPDFIDPATVCESVLILPDAGRLERYPAKVLLAAITQIRPILLAAPGSIGFAYRLHRLRMQAQHFAAARRELVEVEAGRPFPAPLECSFPGIVTKPPNRVDGTRGTAQVPGTRGVFDSVLICL